MYVVCAMSNNGTTAGKTPHRRGLQIRACLVLLFLSLASCTGKKGEATTAGKAPLKEPAAELPLPAIPQSLTSPEARAAFLALHFWDAMDFADHALSLDTAFMEQNFANYLSVFPVLTQDAERREAVRTLLRKAAQDSTALAFLQDVVEKYLKDPNSPMRDEELLTVFYEEMLQIPDVPEWNRERMAWNLETARKNRPGTVAADFAYVSRTGKSGTLHGRHGGGTTLLVFYDPDCDTCKGVLDALGRMPLPRGWHVLAIDAEGDRTRWDETKALLPREWEVGFATTDLVGSGMYSLPALPTLYVLDSTGRVVLKDPTLQQFAAYAEQAGDAVP